MSLYVYPPVNVNTSGLATEANQVLEIAELQNIVTNTSDNATETTLSALDAKVVAVDTTGKATEAKQDSIITQVTTIATNTSDNATETTLSALNAKVVAVDTSAVTISTALPAGTNNIGDIDVVSSVLPTGAATSANQATSIASLSAIESDISDLNDRLAGNLVPETFDHIAITYVAAGNGLGEIETVTYKTGGSGGTTVAVLTLAYDGSDRLSSVARS